MPNKHLSKILRNLSNLQYFGTCLYYTCNAHQQQFLAMFHAVYSFDPFLGPILTLHLYSIHTNSPFVSSCSLASPNLRIDLSHTHTCIETEGERGQERIEARSFNAFNGLSRVRGISLSLSFGVEWLISMQKQLSTSHCVALVSGRKKEEKEAGRRDKRASNSHLMRWAQKECLCKPPPSTLSLPFMQIDGKRGQKSEASVWRQALIEKQWGPGASGREEEHIWLHHVKYIKRNDDEATFSRETMMSWGIDLMND